MFRGLQRDPLEMVLCVCLCQMVRLCLCTRLCTHAMFKSSSGVFCAVLVIEDHLYFTGNYKLLDEAQLYIRGEPGVCVC